MKYRNEIELVESCLQADQMAYKQLYESYAPYVFTICRRYNVEQEACKDFLQEIFINIFNSLNKFDKSKGSLKTWIRRVAINRILSMKRLKKMSFVDIEQVDLTQSSTNDALKNLSKEDLIKYFDNMPVGYRTIFNLSVIDEYSHKEIAKMLNIKPETSRSQLMRARTWLRKNCVENKWSLI